MIVIKCETFELNKAYFISVERVRGLKTSVIYQEQVREFHVTPYEAIGRVLSSVESSFLRDLPEAAEAT